MLGQAFERFPRQVKTVERRIGIFEHGQQPQRVGVVIEPAGIGETALQCILPAMAERRVAKVVGEAQCLGQILVETERASHAATDLRDLDRMGQADAEMIAVGGDEHLRLVAQAAERDRMDDAVAVALERIAGAARADVVLGENPTARRGGMRG